jgi:hypothetical protein
MVWLFLSVLVLAVVATTTFVTPAQAETLGMYADILGVDCAIVDPGPIVFEVYFVHDTAGAQSIFFGALPPPCLGATILAINGLCAINACSIDNFLVPYGQCLSGTLQVASLLMLGSGTTQPCCFYWPTAAAMSPTGHITADDCSGNLVNVVAEPGIFNADASCPCGTTVGTERKSWGGIKSLYVDE